MCWNNVRICEIPLSQAQSAYDAFTMSAMPHPKDIIPRRGLITGAKLVNYFGLSKSESIKNAIYAKFA